MKKFLKRLKIIESMTTTLQASKVEFVNRLNEITDKGSTGIMSDTFDVFSKSKNNYIGQVNFKKFKIKRRNRNIRTRNRRTQRKIEKFY